LNLPLYIEWLPEPFAKKEPSDSDMRKAVREAVKEAVRFGELFALVEARIKALDAAADMLEQYAGSERYENPPEEDFEEDPGNGIGYCRPSHRQADSDYTARHEEFAAALDALDPFVGQAVAADPTPEKTTPAKRPTKRSRKGIGGRPEKFTMKFVSEVVAARERDEKQAAKGRRPLPPIPTWLREYCDGHNIDIRERFPPAVTGEAWSVRANRFWKAATKRLRAAETNRH
jgi:hypothetical protein